MNIEDQVLTRERKKKIRHIKVEKALGIVGRGRYFREDDWKRPQ